MTAWTRTTWLGGMRPQPLRDIPGPKSHAGGNPIVRDEVPGDVAVNRLRADRQQGRQFLGCQEIGAPIQAIEDVGRIRRSHNPVRTLRTVRPAPLNPRWGSIACLARTAAHGTVVPAVAGRVKDRNSEYYNCVSRFGGSRPDKSGLRNSRWLSSVSFDTAYRSGCGGTCGDSVDSREFRARGRIDRFPRLI
jgi:hypothetical protein